MKSSIRTIINTSLPSLFLFKASISIKPMTKNMVTKIKITDWIASITNFSSLLPLVAPCVDYGFFRLFRYRYDVGEFEVVFFPFDI